MADAVVATTLTPYSTAVPLLSGMASWLGDALEQQRIASYQLYEQIYWNVQDTFVLLQRGSDAAPIYIPTARTIVDTTNRYVGKGWGFAVDPTVGTPAIQEAARLAYTNLFRRERLRSRYAGNKRYGLIRGDWMWHVYADPNKAQGRRISVLPIDPASVFPIWDDDDLDSVIGYHIVEQYTDSAGKAWIKRLTYRKNEDGQIESSQGVFPTDKWGGPGMDPTVKPEQTLLPPTLLPPQIAALPVYHIKNTEEPQNPFGSSELRGFERIMAAINQAISDEELSLALEGIGVYATDAGPPTDEEGNETDWVLGPGRVVEHAPNSKFTRVTGVSTVAPYQEHIKFLINSLREATSASDAATGRVDVQVAESGVALLLQLGPMLATAEEKDIIIGDVHNQMLYDLQGWFQAYEGLPFNNEVDVLSTFADKLPLNRKERFAELTQMYNDDVISASYYRAEAAKLGYVFPDTIATDIIQEKAAMAEATAAGDPFLTRASAELDGAGDDAAGD